MLRTGRVFGEARHFELRYAGVKISESEMLVGMWELVDPENEGNKLKLVALAIARCLRSASPSMDH